MKSSRSFFACVSTAALGVSVVVGVVLVARDADASGDTCTWTGAGSGTWSDPGSWSCTSPGSVPGAGDTAVFPQGDAGTVPISGQQAVGSMDVTANAYTFSSVDDGGLTIGTSASFAGGVDHEYYLTAPLSIGSPVSFSTQPLTESSSVWLGAIAFSPGGVLTTLGAGGFVTDGLVSGPGSLIVSGPTFTIENPSNTYSGGTQVLAGQLSASYPGALGSGPITIAGKGALAIEASGICPNALSIGSTSGLALNIQPSDLSGLTWTGPVQLTGPAVVWASGFVIAGPITDAVTGGGLLTLLSMGGRYEGYLTVPIELANADNSYAGGTFIPSGYGPVIADYSRSFGVGPITIQPQGTDSNAGIVELADGVALANAVNAGGLLLSNGAASVTGPITGTGIGLGAGRNGATLTVAGTLTGSANSYGIGLYVHGPSVVAAPTDTGSVLLALASPATYAGHTAISGATFDLGDQSNPLPPSTQIEFQAAPSVLAVHANTEIGGLYGFGGSSQITLDHGSIVTIALGDPANPTQCFTGSITGDGGVTFTGDGGSAFPGTTLDGGDVAGDFTYAYEGPTRIEGNPSTLPTVLALDPSQFGEQYNGSIPNSTITVAGGGELDLGAASAVGPVVGAGGTIVPYPGPATTPDAGAASLTLNADTKVRAVYAGPDAGTSFLAVYGNVSLGNATLTATRAASLPPQGPVVMIANLSDAGVQGTFAGLPEGAVFAASGGVLRISYVGGDGNDVTLEVPLLDGGTEGGLPSDAGEDGDIPDAAPDSMVGVTDANVPEDGRAPSDASTDATLPFEAGSPEAGPVADSAPPLEDGSLTPIEPPSGGCGCETAGAGGASPGALLGLAAIAIVGLRRRRGATSALKSPAS